MGLFMDWSAKHPW